ncbi:hypothetical protein Naga_101216g3 [Nannochloropsis gaditana]|uniref:Uncharacterized protein n=1 Tax=Nannochloropsis gaditana TaxID=72520 RepID=W7T9K6_9STRA|nr:hypothetical protein Naga_101216g3 [Nannochloropsis gaditana]
MRTYTSFPFLHPCLSASTAFATPTRLIFSPFNPSMLPSRAPALCLLLSLSTVSAFLPPSPVIPQLSHSIASSSSKLYLAGEVFPERSPGVEVRRVADTDAGTGIGRYGIKGMVSASDYKNIYRESQKEHKKQANFPGFRLLLVEEDGEVRERGREGGKQGGTCG